MIYRVIDMIVGPEASWSKFTRKIISIGVAAAIGGFAWNEYQKIAFPPEFEQSVKALVNSDRDPRAQVQEEMNNLLKILPGAKGVWLYSWPDARNLDAVMRAGEGEDPFPLGYLRNGDQEAIGSWVLGECIDPDRAVAMCACPINGTIDAWGVLVVTYHEHPPENPSAVQVVARKISNILYHL